MLRLKSLVGSLVLLSVLSAPLLPQEPEPVVAIAGDAPIGASAERILNVIDLILEHHIDPPTRQEMLLSGARALMVEAKLNAPHGLSRRVSDLATRSDCAAFLVKLLGDALAAGLSRGDIEQTLTHGILKAVPGQPVLMPAKELKVQRSLQDNQYVGIGIALSKDSDGFSIGAGTTSPEA